MGSIRIKRVKVISGISGKPRCRRPAGLQRRLQGSKVSPPCPHLHRLACIGGPLQAPLPSLPRATPSTLDIPAGGTTAPPDHRAPLPP
jgi:hypothetical protein